MKQKSSWRAGFLALLCMLTAVSLSLTSSTMARYTATAQLQASARVARWQPQITSPATNRRRVALWQTGHVATAAITNPPHYQHITFTITNFSEVPAYMAVRVTFTRSRYAQPNWNSTRLSTLSTVTVEPIGGDAVTPIALASRPPGAENVDGVWRFQPNQSAQFRLRFTRPSGIHVGLMCRVNVRAIQVD